ncbi:hypothetical protein [Roseomonas sp. BN140053]|uniref:hypothetical protein n=1 Tax=Roseomonas sp. BN140053 TaxID=3391898 RepID=UPI0039E79FDB
MSVPVMRCDRCGQTCYPARLLCFRCGHDGWTALPCETGVVEECTTLPGRDDQAPLVLASIRSALGPVMVARLPAVLPRGTPVRLRPGEARSVLAEKGEDA